MALGQLRIFVVVAERQHATRAAEASNIAQSATMDLPSLVVTVDQDFSERFSGPRDWRADAYRLSPGPKWLATLCGAGHMFGGISGYDAKETSDENPRLVAAVQRMTWAYLRSGLYPDDPAWRVTIEAEASGAGLPGRLECK